jgi:hypothetical protein
MAQEYQLPVIAGRAGSFGLILGALGVDAWDGGLGERESYSLTRLNQPRRDTAGRSRGGRGRRIYLRSFLTSVAHEVAGALIRTPELRRFLLCDLSPCTTGGIEYQLEHPREHFLHSRRAEVELLMNTPAGAMRVQHMHGVLTRAIGAGRQMNRILEEKGVPPVDVTHLDRWVAVLSRVATDVAIGAER